MVAGDADGSMSSESVAAAPETAAPPPEIDWPTPSTTDAFADGSQCRALSSRPVPLLMTAKPDVQPEEPV
jgi:hypothetical protein